MLEHIAISADTCDSIVDWWRISVGEMDKQTSRAVVGKPISIMHVKGQRQRLLGWN